jgi:acetyl-CoA carboxylase biotin carboxyl carrier protein
MSRDLTASLTKRDDGKLELGSPSVGLWRDVPARGALVREGDSIGWIETLGVVHRLVSPATGFVDSVPESSDLARRPVAYGQSLLLLTLEGADAVVSGSDSSASEVGHGELVLRAPSSGRFYARPGPDKAPFVSAGDDIAVGQTVCLLEVMKTFNRVPYEGDGLPERARVVKVVPEDGADLNARDVIIEVEPAD